MAEEYKIKAVHFPPSEHEYHWQCPQCGRGVTNKQEQWEINIQR